MYPSETDSILKIYSFHLTWYTYCFELKFLHVNLQVVRSRYCVPCLSPS